MNTYVLKMKNKYNQEIVEIYEGLNGFYWKHYKRDGRILTEDITLFNELRPIRDVLRYASYEEVKGE